MLDPQSPVPLYHQVKDALRREIAGGRYPVGETIPPERQLVQQFGVSRITVRQAVTDLEAEGLLQRRHGKGTYVAPGSAGAIAESLSELTGHLEELQRQNLNPQVEVLALLRLPLPADVAGALRRASMAEGWFLHRRVSVADAPLMLTEVWLPADLGIALDETAVQSRGMAQLLTENGRPPAHGRQRIGAVVAGDAEAQLLQVPRGQAVLRVIRTIMGADGRPLVWFRTLYRADRYEYEVELKRRR